MNNKYPFVIGLLLLTAVINQSFSLPKLEDLQVMLHNKNLSYDRKMALKIGYDLYYYYKFIAENTPENAKIYKPPMMYPWPYTGNAGYSLFFLYPRELINGKLEDTQISSDAEYALLIWSEVPAYSDCTICGWPKAPYATDKIIYYKKTPPWGLIKLK